MADVKVAMISSTIKDLSEHREKVLDACLRQKVQPSMMEHWPSSDANGVSASLKKVDEADIYIGVFAHRYGYIPEHSDISISEMEYKHAVQRGIPRLIFLIHKDHDLKISQIETEATHKIENLKQRLQKENTVSFFQNPDDLSAKLIQSLSNLDLYRGQVADVLSHSLVPQAPSFNPDNYIFFVPYRSKGQQVLGRGEPLRAVRAQLIAGRRTAIGQTASFRGLGGLGKTQLAVEYAYLFRDQYPNGVIFLNADQDIEAQLISIAEKAKWVAPISDHKDKLSIATRRLRTRSHCLIIFDNLDNGDRIKDYLPEPEAEPHILVTSRVDHAQFVPIPIELLDFDTSLQLLLQESNQTPSNDEEKIAASEIATKLAGLPLALELAGAYLQHRPIGWVRYRDLLNENLKSAFPAKFASASFTRHETDLYSTLKINDTILADEPTLKEVLDVLTWSGSSAIGIDLLSGLLDVRPAQLSGALSLGVSLRLLQKTPKSERYALHRLVREVRREDVPLNEKKEWALAISKRLASWFQSRKRKFSDLPQFETEIDHLTAWQVNASEFSPILSSRLLWLQAYPPFHRGRYQDSYSLLKTAHDILSASGYEDLELQAEQLSDLCTIYTSLGRFTDGRKCGEDALAIRLRLYGEKHSETAMTIHNLAGSLRAFCEFEGKKEDLKKCLEYDEKALTIWREINGEDHIDTALALDAVSLSHRALGDFPNALKYAQQSFALREKLLGSNSPDTIASLTNLGRLHSALGQQTKALEYHERAIKIADQLFGDRSTWRATLLNEMGVVYYAMKNPGKSLEFELASLALRRELFGNEHHNIAISVNNIVSCYLDLGRQFIAIQFLQEFLRSIPKTAPKFDMLKERLRDLQIKFPRPGFRQLPRRRH